MRKPLAVLAALALTAGCKSAPAPQPSPAAIAPAAAAPSPASAPPAAPAAAAGSAPAAPTAAPPATPPVPLTPEEETQAVDLITNNCLSCHTVEMLEQQRLTAKQWDAEMKKMQGWGSPLEAEHVELLVRYATAHYGQSAPRYEMKVVGAREAAVALAPQHDGVYGRGSVKEGQKLYAAQCLLCHGADGKGAALGVNLVDRPSIYRARDFAALVRQGRGRMPAFTSTDPQVAALLAYLRTLKP